MSGLVDEDCIIGKRRTCEEDVEDVDDSEWELTTRNKRSRHDAPPSLSSCGSDECGMGHLPIEVLALVLAFVDNAAVFGITSRVSRLWRDVESMNEVWYGRCISRWGVTRCLTLCSGEGRGMDWKAAMRQRAGLMRAAVATCTGLNTATKTEIGWLVRSMGGSVRGPLTSSVRVVVGGSRNTAKATAALKHGVPVVTCEWVHVSFVAGQLANPRSFLLPALTGYTVCVTGGSSELREMIREVCERHGALFDLTLHRQVSHLIALGPTPSRKTEAARAWGHVSIVTPDWLLLHLSPRLPADLAGTSVLQQQTALM